MPCNMHAHHINIDPKIQLKTKVLHCLKPDIVSMIFECPSASTAEAEAGLAISTIFP